MAELITADVPLFSALPPSFYSQISAQNKSASMLFFFSPQMMELGKVEEVSAPLV